MKYIKTFRIFESEEEYPALSWEEMLDLGIIRPEDLPGIIASLDEPAKLELVKPLVEKYSIERAIKLFGDKSIIRRAYQDNPLEFLNQFNDLTPIEKGDIIYYVDKDNKPLFYYYPNDKNGYVYINYNKIWMFFSKVIGLKYTEIPTIIKNWLEVTYNLKGLTPDISMRF